MVPAALAPGNPAMQAHAAMPHIPPKLKAPPPAKIRFQSEDGPAPAPAPARAPAAVSTPAPAPTPAVPTRVDLCKPETLGIRLTTVAPANWTESLARLEARGMANFQVQQVGEGWRFVCQMRTAQEGRHQRIEVGPVASKAEAIRLALIEAER
jgi:cell division septation protein DedD